MGGSEPVLAHWGYCGAPDLPAALYVGLAHSQSPRVSGHACTCFRCEQVMANTLFSSQHRTPGLQVRRVTRQDDACASRGHMSHIKAQLVIPATERATQGDANLINTFHSLMPLLSLSLSAKRARAPVGEEEGGGKQGRWWGKAYVGARRHVNFLGCPDRRGSLPVRRRRERLPFL